MSGLYYHSIKIIDLLSGDQCHVSNIPVAQETIFLRKGFSAARRTAAERPLPAVVVFRLNCDYVDNGSSKWGKVRQYEIHIVLLWVDVVLMFMIPSGWGTTAKYILIFLLYTLNCAVFQTFLNCTDPIYLRRAFKDDNQRTVVQTVSGGVGMVAMYLGVMLMPLMIDYFEDIPGGWTMMVLICAVPMAIIGSIRFFLFPEVEKVEEVTKENRATILETLKTFITNKYVLLITAIYFCVQLQSNMQSTPSTYYFTYIVGNLSLMSLVTLVGYIAATGLGNTLGAGVGASLSGSFLSCHEENRSRFSLLLTVRMRDRLQKSTVFRSCSISHCRPCSPSSVSDSEKP